MKNIFNEISEKLDFYQEILKAIENKKTPLLLTGVSSIHKAQLALALCELKSCCIICDTEASARRICDDINSLSHEESACLFPAKDFNFAYIDSFSREYEHKRIEALSKIKKGISRIIVTTVEAAMQGTITPSALKKYSFDIKCGEDINLKELVASLVSAGYTECEQIEGQAQFSVRGGIVDIFPVHSSLPYRIELWGDTVESIHTFEIESQRRLEKIKSFTVSPAVEIIFPSNEFLSEKIKEISKKPRGKKADKIKEKLSADLDAVEAGISLNNLDKYYSLAYDECCSVVDYFKNDLIIISENSNCKEQARSVSSQLTEDIKMLYEDGILFKALDGFYCTYAEILSKSEKSSLLYFSTFMRGGEDLEIKSLINANPLQTSGWSGDIRHLIEELTAYCNQNYCVIVFAGSEKTLPILTNDLRDSKIPAEILNENSEIKHGLVYVTYGSTNGGFEYPDIKCAVITGQKISSPKKKARKKYKKGEEIKNLSDISNGDLVVHSLYGIGKFSGIQKLETGGVTKDYIKINYAGSDILYVPVTQLDLVSRYIGPRDDAKVKLNKLNSLEWQKTRKRVKTAVKDMADELIKLYAKRQLSKGFSFSPDNDWQADFEERFDYQETDDQLRSIDEIKEDMQKPVPMDRLLCGDVGFGKTEVALRACFKCVLDSKQCAILAPTTVLAWQHYQTAVKRFEHFPVKIELLSRFRTPKQQKEIIKDLKRGVIDMVIGTHRLVQKDVEFKNLGLAVIDEEQRFGVAHKERFKEMFSGIDILTLSATPIPRTLNMAMSGIRDMSVIEEPPQDRYPVQTYVIEHNDGVIANAVSKELRRGGQVYYIHNRIETIDRCVSKLQKLLPDAKIGVAHGQISENELSEIWRQLIDKEIDILVCTTLIETGVDVPNVNTLIIEDADRLGLSQLYQLRGRVGRSNRRAFAYFTFRRGKVLTEIASKRLNAIREFTQFGSGFRIAMRDLEIRGAGSILSGKQHGHMEAVGYEMYLRLLNEAIAEQKGEALPSSPEDCLVDVAIDAYIPEKYIKSLSQRIDAYRKIASIQSSEDSNDVLDELSDRYGKPPAAVLGLVNVALMRNTASKLGITEITQRGDSLYFYIKSPTVEQITSIRKVYQNRVQFEDVKKPHIKIQLLQKPKKQKSNELMNEVLNIMNGGINIEDIINKQPQSVNSSKPNKYFKGKPSER